MHSLSSLHNLQGSPLALSPFPSKPPYTRNMEDRLKSPPHLHGQNPEEEEEEAEEALSLCDLPLKTNDEDEDNRALEEYYSSNHSPRSRSETPDFFQFFSDFSSEMCPADDIFFCGKLVAIKEQHFSPASHQIPQVSTVSTEESQTNKTTFRRRSDSLSKIQRPVTRSNSGNSNPEFKRNCRSLDYKKLHQSSNSMISTAPEIERNSSAKSVQGKYDTVPKKAAGKPRWYFLMFGMVKFPPEMELSDMKNRQVRRNPPSTLFPPPTDIHGKIPANQSSGSKVSWRLLRALSCKDHATSVAVTASFCIRHEKVLPHT